MPSGCAHPYTTFEVVMADIEKLKASREERLIWEREVLTRCRSKCVNCGGPDNLRVRMIVPPEAGGQLVESNGTVLCRTCEMAQETFAKRATRAENRRPINFWVSRRLYNRLQNGLKAKNGFESMGALIRYLMAKYIGDPERFADLQQYQEEASPDVKVNAWVGGDEYGTFKVLVDRNGMTVTDTIKALIVMYENEAEVLMRSK